MYHAYLECRKNKRNTINALHFEADLLENLHRLGADLRARTYKPSRSVCFVVHKPKLREIFAADFRDRIVHRLLVDLLEPLFAPAFIHDSYACRRGKGTLKAVERLRSLVRQASRNGNRPAHYLQVDVRSFFMSVHRPTLYGIIDRRMRRRFGERSRAPRQMGLPGLAPVGADETATLDALLWLSRTIIDHDPTQNYVIKGDPRVLSSVPPHKSLFGAESECGLPIGNLTSQFFAAVYLDRLDQFVKHQLKVERYVRYVDDCVIVEPHAERFDEYVERIDGFLRRELRLSLKRDAVQTGRVSTGIDFLGYIQRPSHILVRRRVVNNLKQRLLGFEERLVHREGDRVVYRFPNEALEQLLAILNGYLAHFAHADTQQLRTSIPEHNPYLNRYFRFHGGRPSRRYPRQRAFPSFAAQVHMLAGERERAGEMVFIRVGAFYELYGRSARWATGNLGLQRLAPRRGLRARCGFHQSQKERFIDRTIAAGKSVAVVEEVDERIGALRLRRLDRVIEAAPAGIS